MSFKENSNLCPSCYMMKSQLDNNNNIRTLNVIKEQDYANFRQLMDIALKNFSLKEKHKYMERVFDNSNHSISIGYPSSYCFEYCEDDIFSEWSSNEASGQLPYEINFDDDDDFEQVLPKFVTWDLATTESDMSSSNIKTTDDSDFQYINCVSKTKSTNTLNKPRSGIIYSAHKYNSAPFHNNMYYQITYYLYLVYTCFNHNRIFTDIWQKRYTVQDSYGMNFLVPCVVLHSGGGSWVFPHK